MSAPSVLRPVRVLVIGAGPATVELHLPVLARLREAGRIELALVCDLQHERALAARRAFGFGEDCADAASALQRPDIDAVYLLGSAQLHHDCGLAALRADKHLFVEKPIAPSYAQACAMVATARRRGLIAAGGHNRRFFAPLEEIRARAGRTRWRCAEAVFHKAEFGAAPPFGARTWLGANGIQRMDALVYMMGGLPEQLLSLAAAAGSDHPGAFSALMRWPDGAQATFLCNNGAGARREEYVFHGPGETCTASMEGLTLAKDGVVRRQPSAAGSVMAGSIAAEHHAFLDAIRDGGDCRHSLESLAPSLFLAELIEAGFSGPVQLPGAQPAAVARPRSSHAAILVTQPAGLLPSLARLLPQYRLVSLEECARSAGPRPDIVAAILGRGSAALPADLLARLPSLAIVGVVALSVARHAPETLLARGILLVNASAAHAESVAEFAFGLATLARRRAFLSCEVMRRGGWGTDLRDGALAHRLRRAARGARPLIRAMGMEAMLRRRWNATSWGGGARTASAARELRGATAGLVGWGANARAFAARLSQARVRILVFSEHAEPQEILACGATPASLAEVLSADIVSLHRGLNADTRHCLGAAELERLRSGAVLVNVARGALIEPAALLARLRRGDVFACLDSFEEEPLPARHPLRRLPNVFLTAHIAGGSCDMQAAAAEEVVRKVAAYLAGDGVMPLVGERLRTMT